VPGGIRPQRFFKRGDVNYFRKNLHELQLLHGEKSVSRSRPAGFPTMERMEFMEFFLQGSANGSANDFFYHEGNEVLEGSSSGSSKGWEIFIFFRSSWFKKSSWTNS
jgi:hypothetical protein